MLLFETIEWTIAATAYRRRPRAGKVRKNFLTHVQEIRRTKRATIDRLIFLRICEDRGMETYGRLQVLPNGPNIYRRLCELFREADHRYNSGLFHFAAEKDRQQLPDEWTLGLTIDDAVLKEIIRKLYYPDSPNEFSVIGAEILGQVYEQFLGKVIRLTAGHHASRTWPTTSNAATA